MGDENSNNMNNKDRSSVVSPERTGKFKVTAEPAIFLLYLGVTLQVCTVSLHFLKISKLKSLFNYYLYFNRRLLYQTCI